MPILIALSRLNSYFKCQRDYFWNYEYKGSGVRGAKSPIPLAVGGAVHSGLQALLSGTSVEAAVQAASSELRDRLQKSPLLLEPNEDVLESYAEQEKLIEALVRVYARRGLPKLTNDYEIIEVEQEYDLKLSDNVILRSRADGLLRKRSDGRLYVLSFKTAKRYDRRHSSDGNHDVQGLAEAAAIEGLRGEEINGVQMEYLIKGDRQESRKGSGRYIQNTPLLHPWKKDGIYAHSFAWSDCNGGGHRLGKGWERINIWDDMSISDWITRCERIMDQPEAGDSLESVCVQPPPYYRRHSELEDWIQQTRVIGEQLFAKRNRLSSTEEMGVGLREFLNVNYPQNRRACDWPSACSMQGICFGPCGSEPEETGLYQIRRKWIYEGEEES